MFVNPLYFHTRERLGALGGIVQHHTALYRSVAVYEPAVLIVRRGSKKLRRVRRSPWQADRRLTSSIFPIQTASIRRNGLLSNRKP
ncbi:AraC family transcriptional regulator [Neisseria meningitidis]|nr:AraC family transcriptional regulator [Neisseria meningitidis]